MATEQAKTTTRLTDSELADQFARTLSGNVAEWPQLRPLLARLATVADELETLKAERDRLAELKLPTGDDANMLYQQSRAWSTVWSLLSDLGIYSFVPEDYDGKGLTRAIEFIKQLAAAQAEVERLRRATERLINSALTCGTKNMQTWMKYFAERINQAAEAIGEKDRCEFDGENFRIVRAALAPQEQPHAE